MTVCLDEDLDRPVEARWLEEKLGQVLAWAGVRRGRLGVVVVGDATMARLHEQYGRQAGTTDVLTFDLSDGPGPEGAVEGEVYVCLDEARRQACRRGHGVAEELLLYAVHGLLHLLGEDDAEPEAAARMHAREDALLEAVGVGAVYARPAQQPEQREGRS